MESIITIIGLYILSAIIVYITVRVDRGSFFPFKWFAIMCIFVPFWNYGLAIISIVYLLVHFIGKLNLRTNFLDDIYGKGGKGKKWEL